MKKSMNGFTVIELLIVIVVVAILAVVSITAYNGIQERSRTSIVMSDLATAKKKFSLYKAANGKFPTTSSELSGAEISVTQTNYAGISGAGNMVYCLNTDTDEYSFVAKPTGSATAHYITSHGGPSPMTGSVPTGFANVCGLIGATSENRWVQSGLGSGGAWVSWL